MQYPKGSWHTGEIRRSSWSVEGVTYDSPSGAAKGVTGVSLNGWKYWYATLPGQDTWVSLSHLRYAAKKRLAAARERKGFTEDRPAA
jgi:hypothetical protein